MKLFIWRKRICALLLAAIWAAYAAMNLVHAIPSLATVPRRSWGIPNLLATAVETADGGVLFQEHLQNLNGSMLKAMGRETLNGFSLVRGTDGQLQYTNFYPYEVYDFAEPAQRISRLALAAEEQGASLLYVNTADRYVEENADFGLLPANNMNPRSDAFLHALRGYGVAYLDTRAVLRDSPLSADRYHYKTEPHWTIEACFETYLALVDYLNRQGGDIDPEGFYTSRQLFRQMQYPRSYLGKLGKIAGAPYAGYDDFTMIVPAFETRFTLRYAEYAGRVPVEGGFTSVLLDDRWLEGDNAYDKDFYCAYLTEVYPQRMITNNLNEGGSRVLLVGDSSMLPVAAFLSTAVGEVHLLSPYSLPYSTDNLVDYLVEHSFDHVVIGLNPGTLNEGGFRFLEGIELPAAG